MFLHYCLGSVPQSNHFNPAFGGASAPATSYLTSALENASSGQAFSQYEKWSSGLELGLINGGLDLGALTNAGSDLDEKLQNVQLYPPRSQIKRQKMVIVTSTKQPLIYYFKIKAEKQQ